MRQILIYTPGYEVICYKRRATHTCQLLLSFRSYPILLQEMAEMVSELFFLIIIALIMDILLLHII